MSSAASSLVIVGMMALGNIMPQQRQILQEITGLSAVTLGVLPVILLLGMATCSDTTGHMDHDMVFPGADASLDMPCGMPLLVVATLLGIFAAALLNTEDNENKKEETRVELVRADRIAMRLSCAAGLLGLYQMFFGITSPLGPSAWRSLPQTMGEVFPSSPREGFAKSEVVVEASEGTQFLCISILLFIFKLALNDEEDQQSSSQVQLVSASRIASRLAVATACLGLMQFSSTIQMALGHVQEFLCRAVPTSSHKGFASSDAALEVPESFLLFSISSLLFIFKMAISEDSADTKDKSSIQLVRADAIALRLSLGAGLWGFLKMIHESDALACASSSLESFSQMLVTTPVEGFGKSEVSLGASEGLQLLAVSMLFFIFKMAVSDADDTKESSTKESTKEEKDLEKGRIQLVNANAIASRFALAAMVLGCLKLGYGDFMGSSAWSGLGHAVPEKQTIMEALMFASKSFPRSPQEGFANSDIVLEARECIQVVAISVLLLMFKLAIDSDDVSEKPRPSEVKPKPKVQLVSASRIALRLAIAGGTIGLGKFAAPAVTHSMSTLTNSVELLAKGGMLTTGTALALWGAHKQTQNSKI